jgi:DNA-directed RNA polymerase subunit omega
MDLISLPVEFDKKKIDNRYRLVIAAGKRAKMLFQGAQTRIASKAKKLTTVAIEEVISGPVHVLSGEAAVKAEEEAKKLPYQEIIDEAKQKVSHPEEELTELEKDLKVYLHKKEEKGNKESREKIFPEKKSQ